jgi:hypothetical protein
VEVIVLNKKAKKNNSGTVVREILNQTNNVLYDSCEDLDNSIFSDSMMISKPDSDSEKEKKNQIWHL